MKKYSTKRCIAFTLIEMLASMAVLAVLITLVYGVLAQASKAWVLAENRTETYQSARLAIEMLARDLEGAIVETNDLPSPNGLRLTFLTREDANTGTNSTGVTDIVETPPNDQVFFVANCSETAGEKFIDLAEYGYFVIFAKTNKVSISGPGYYLLRHQCRSHDSNNNPINGYNIFSSPTNWFASPVMDPNHKVPIADNVFRLELDYEKVGGTDPEGTCKLTNWYSAYGSCTAPASPPDTLPRAVHIMMCALDRRYSARAYAIIGTNGLSSTELDKIPYSMDGMSNVGLQNIFQEGMRTFFRTVYLKNAQ